MNFMIKNLEKKIADDKLILRSNFINEYYVPSEEDWNQSVQSKKNHLKTDLYATILSSPIYYRINFEETLKNLRINYDHNIDVLLDKIDSLNFVNRRNKLDFKRLFRKYLENYSVDFDYDDGNYGNNAKEKAFDSFFKEHILKIFNIRNKYSNVYYEIPDDDSGFDKIKQKILSDLNSSGIFNYLDESVKKKTKEVHAYKIQNSKLHIKFITSDFFLEKDIKKIIKFLEYQYIDGWGDMYEFNVMNINKNLYFHIYFWVYGNKNWKIKVLLKNKKIR